MDWKKLTFKEVFNKLIENNRLMNIISIGDAEFEYNALIELDKIKPEVKKLLKSVKLLKNPNYVEKVRDADESICQKVDLFFNIFKSYLLLLHLDLCS